MQNTNLVNDSRCYIEKISCSTPLHNENIKVQKILSHTLHSMTYIS